MKIENRTIWCDAIQFKVKQDSRKGNYLTVISSKENVTEVNIPKTVTVDGKKLEVKSIDSYAFCNCSDLKSITIPEGVTSIGYQAFSGCASLTSIVIPEGVTSIGSGAFKYCTLLTSIVIPEGVTSIGDDAFSGCDSLTIYCAAEAKPEGWSGFCFWNISDDMPVVWGHVVYGASDSFLYDISRVNGDTYAVITGYRGSDTDIRIPETINGVKVAVISNRAFKGCASLTSIVIPEGVTSIGDEAFAGCASLTSIVIPEGVTSIGWSAFEGCDSLTIYCAAETKPEGWSDGLSGSWNSSYRPVVWGHVVFGASDSFLYGISKINNNTYAVITGYKGSDTDIRIPATINGVKVAAISGGAFYGCSSLKSVTIPDSVASIGDRVFEGCDSLTIYCAAEAKPKGWSGVWNISDMPVVWGHVVFGASDSFLCSISKVNGDTYAVITGYRGSDTDIRIPEKINGVKVAVISDCAFEGCESLKSVAIPDSVTSIGRNAFKGCASLTSVNIGNDVTSIGQNAFEGCASLTSVNIGNGVTSIDWYAFKGCDSLTIYCAAESKPAGWFYEWNSSNRPVVWGYKSKP